MKVFWDPVQLGHDPRFFLQRGVVRQNFERPARAEALLTACRGMGLAVHGPGRVDRGALEAVHEPAFLDFLRDGLGAWAALEQPGAEMVPNIHPTAEMLAQGARPGPGVIGQVGWFTVDTSCPVGVGTWAAVEAAAACAVAAADEVAGGRHAYALCRPPGHHAYRSKASGHCYLNNAAIAAQRLRDRGAGRVAVLDIDSHHGNGTQGIFWERGDVFFASVHGDPEGYFPWYVGHAGERGVGAGEGANLNLPLARGGGDGAWLEAIGLALGAVRGFGADALVLSLGFDASVDEPLGFLAVTGEGFARAGEAVAGLGVPTAIVQEGGYNVEVIGGLLGRMLPAFG